MKRTLTIIPVILCLVFSQLHAQVFTHYRSAVDYNYMTDVAFDKEGHTWYATYAAGVLKYDGSGWTNFTVEDGLASDRTNAITCDAEGNIWVVTLKGISVYDGAEWTSYFEANDSDQTDFRFGTIEADSFGNIWVTKNYGILKYNGSEWTQVFAFSTKDNAIAVDTDSIFWLGGDGGVSYYKGGATGWDGIWINYTTEDGLVDNNVRAIEIDPDGNVWFGTEGGVSKFDGTDWTSYTEENGLPGNDIIDIAIDTEGRIWCASPFSVSVFDGQSWTTPEKPDFALGLIHSVVAADNGTILIGFNFEMLFNSYLRYDGSNWTVDTFDECVAGYVSSITEDDQGNKWFGTNAGLSKLENGIWTSYTIEDDLAGLRVNDLFIDSEGSIWCATVGGVSVFNGTSWTSYTMDDGLTSNVIRTITQDGSGNFWAGTENGVSVFDGTTWTSYTTAEGLASDRVRVIEIDPEGNVWIGTDDGLTKFDGSVWSTYRTEDGLSDNNINGIAFDTSGHVFCATGKGVSSFNGSEWTTLGEGNIAHIAFDSNNALWIVPAGEWGSPEGLTKFDGTKFIHYTADDGLSASGCIFLDSGDTLWIGSMMIDAGYTTSGFSKMDPKTDFTAPMATVTYNDDDLWYGDTLVVTATFDKPILYSSGVKITLKGAVELSEATMLRENETTYSYAYVVPNQEGEVTVSLSGGKDLWGNDMVSTPVSGESFSISAVTLGDVDGDGQILAYDAALALLLAHGGPELFCFLPQDLNTFPWPDRNRMVAAANVDGVEGVSLDDAKLILQYSANWLNIGFIETFQPSSSSAGVAVIQRDNYLEFYSTGRLIGLNIEISEANGVLGTPELTWDNNYSSFFIDDNNYNIALCNRCPPMESTLLMKIPILGEGSVTLYITTNKEFNFDWMWNPLDLEYVPDTTGTKVSDHPDPADLMIYPNPADDLLMLEGLREPGILKIFSVSGMLMKTASLQAGNAEIDVSGLPDGIYLLNIETKEGIIVKRISVQ